MDKGGTIMVAIGAKPKAEPPRLGPPGATAEKKPARVAPSREEEPESEPEERSARDKLRYLRDALKECMAVLGEEEPENEEESEISA